MAGVGKLLKQAAKMQKQLEALQTEMGEKTLEVSSGGGAVKVTISLQQEVRAIRLDPEFLKEEATVVEEAVTEAVREAVAQSKKMNDEAVQKITQSLQVPGMPSLF
ncbi:MAG: YbaB/EbfC family nucleoid-associated protein [Opitutales bacterium]|nr:YbaB/EbfC family nucleoid-associated protein [Opitutales bacterium]